MSPRRILPWELLYPVQQGLPNRLSRFCRKQLIDIHAILI